MPQLIMIMCEGKEFGFVATEQLNSDSSKMAVSLLSIRLKSSQITIVC